MDRGMKFGEYNTALNLWTLSEWELSPAKHQENLVDVPGRQAGPLDLSTALTDGEPVFESRALTATFESSEGSRLERKARIDIMVNQLAGLRKEITLPDDPGKYMLGRLTVTELYNDLAHCAVQVDAICEPWKYSKEQNVVALTASAEEAITELPNAGRLTVAPMVEIIGEGAAVILKYGAHTSAALGPGKYVLPGLQIPMGGLDMAYSGSGSVRLTYREAVL